MTGTILIIDDEEKLRALLSRIISLEGFRVLEAGTLKAALKVLEKETIDIALCDAKLPDGNGVEFTKQIKSRFPAIEVILLTAFGNIPDGVEAMKNGAFDYITKGDDNGRILPLLNNTLQKIQLQKRIIQLEEQVDKKYSFDNIIGSSPLIVDAITLAYFKVPGVLEKEGTGLGLSISKEFIEAQGGEIFATSKIGEGSAFGFSLPVSSVSSQ